MTATASHRIHLIRKLSTCTFGLPLFILIFFSPLLCVLCHTHGSFCNNNTPNYTSSMAGIITPLTILSLSNEPFRSLFLLSLSMVARENVTLTFASSVLPLSSSLAIDELN